MRNKLSTQLKKRLSLLLALIMVLSVGAMMDWTSLLLPIAAASSGGNYQVRVYMQNHNTDSDSDFMWCKVYGHDQSGSTGTIADSAYFDEPTGRDYYSGTYTTPYFPTSFNAYWESHKCDKSDYGNNTYVQVYYNGGWQTVMSSSMSSNSNKTGNATYSCSCSGSTGTRPSINSVSITGGANQTISKGWHEKGTSGAISAAAYDQFGVKWYQNPTWSTSADTLSTTGNAASVTLSSTSYSDHSATVKASLGGKSASTTVTFKWKHRLTVTNAGNGTSGTFDDYSGNTKALSAGSRTGYDFSSWTKSGTGSLNSTTSATPTWTFGNGDGSVTTNWTIHTSTLKVNPNSGTWNGNTTEQSYTQNYNTTKSIPLPTKSGWTFTGWQKSATFYGTLSSTTAAATYTYPANKGVTSTITATWKRDMSNTYHYYKADATTDQTVVRTATAYNTATTQAFTTPAASEVVTEVSKNDKTWTLKGWGSSTVWGGATQAATLGFGATNTVSTGASDYSYYPVYALKTTKFYANYNYLKDEQTAYTKVQKNTTVNGDATTGVMPVATGSDNGSGADVAKYYSKAGVIYELKGWSQTEYALDDENAVVEIPYGSATATLAVPGAGTPTSTANQTPIELYPVYDKYATAIHAHFNFYTDGEVLDNLDVSGMALGDDTSGTVTFPGADQVTTSYKKGNVTYTLVGWNLAPDTDAYTAFGGSATHDVLANPATDYYTYYPVYTCTTTFRYHTYTAAGAQTSQTETTTLYKYDDHTPNTADVAVPTDGFDKQITLDGRVFTFCGWRDDTTSADKTIAIDAGTVNKTIRDDEYHYYAVYQSDKLALSYNGINGAPVPETQYKTQFINAGTGAANINNATPLTFDINPANVTPEKTGYTYIGWQDTNNAEQETATYAKTGGRLTTKINKTLYAVYSINDMAINFTYWSGNGYRTDTKYIKYDDSTRSDSGAARYVTTGNELDTVPIDHKDQTNHYYFTGWAIESGNATIVENVNGTKKSATISKALTDVNVQAKYQGVSHHWVTVVDEDHPYVEATCTEDGYYYHYCSDCGYEDYHAVIPATGHDMGFEGYKAPTCTQDGKYAISVCSNCGLKSTDEGFGDAKYYDFVDGNYVAVDATDRVIAKLGHDWVVDTSVGENGVVAPTCTAKGYTAYVCRNNAGHTKYENYVDATGHTPVTGEAKDATCTEAGYTAETKCSVCGAVITASKVIPAKGHTLVIDVAVAPTCTETGLTEGKHCSVCGAVAVAQEVVPALGHDYEITEAKPATCTEPGHSAGKVCKRCGDIPEGSTAVVTEPAKGHLWDAGVHTDSDKPCKTAGYTTFTCQREGCGATNVVYDELTEHVAEEVPAKAATCIEEGYEAYTRCSVCGEALTEYKPIAKTAHNWVVDAAAKAATCTEAGYTASYKCSTEGCDATLASTPIAALGHSFGRWIVTKNATCTEAGEKMRMCARCNLEETEEIAALEHDYVEVAEVPATCAEAGVSAGVKCAKCGDIQSGCEVIPATNEHSFGEYTVVTDSTCTAVGAKKHVCSVCGLEETEVIEMKEHTFETLAAEDATCTKIGHTAGKRCTVCGYKEGYEAIAKKQHTEVTVGAAAATCTTAGSTGTVKCSVCDLVISEAREIPATGHKMDSDWVLVKAATCTETGLRERVCSVCGENKETKVLPAIGHNMTYVAAKAASCGVEGHRDYYKCSRCEGKFYVDEAGTDVYDTVVTPALEHNWTVTGTVAATCTEKGYTKETCANCNEIREVNEVDPLGHTGGTATCKDKAVCTRCGIAYGGYADHNYSVETIEGTCAENGKEIRTCTVCGKVVTITLAKGDHQISHEVTTAPTCTANGYFKDVCTICGTVVMEGTVAAKGHTDADKDGVCDECGATLNTPSGATGTCDQCGRNHAGKEGGFFGYNGFICKLIAFVRRLVKMFNNG